MFDVEEYKNKITEYYHLKKGHIKLFINHFLGENYEINIENKAYKNISNVIGGKGTIELNCGSKSAEISRGSEGLKISFYDACMNDKKLFAFIRFSHFLPEVKLKILVQEYMYDDSIIVSRIEGAEIGARSSYLNRKSLITDVNYYDSKNFEHFDEDDKKDISIFNIDNLDSLCFKPDYSTTVKRESSENYKRDEAFTQFIDARKSIDEKIKGGENAAMTQKLVRGE